MDLVTDPVRAVMPKETRMACNRSGKPERHSCRQTKLWISNPGQVGRQVTKFDRGKLSKIIQPITGHNYPNYQWVKFTESKMHKYRFCDREQEEFFRLACECPALAEEQRKAFHKLPLSGDTFGSTSLIRFISMAVIGEAMNQMRVE